MRASGQLRGLCQVDVEVRCLKRPVHSSARARIAMRTVSSMDSREAGQLLIRKLTRNPPHGARVQARISRRGG